MRRVQRRGLRLGAAFLLAGCLAGPLSLRDAHAHISVCRDDPVLNLSNGAQLVLYEDVYDSASDITSINYRVRVPVGVKVTSIQYVGPVPSRLQHITVTADESTGNYDAYTTVNTGAPNISVTAYMSGTPAGGTSTVSCQTNGQSGQQLHSHLHF